MTLNCKEVTHDSSAARRSDCLLPRAPRSECKSFEPLAGQDYFRGSPNLQKVDLLSLSVCGCLARQLKPLKASMFNAQAFNVRSKLGARSALGGEPN